MSLFDTDEIWYEAEIAKSGKSRCFGDGCKEITRKGELRIGIICEDKNDSHGWYHPTCLWATFLDRQFSGNPRITKMDDIKNHENLSIDIRNEIQNLIDNCTTHTANLKRELEEQSVETPPETPQYAMSGSI
jgi:hypothetical protein